MVLGSLAAILPLNSRSLFISHQMTTSELLEIARMKSERIKLILRYKKVHKKFYLSAFSLQDLRMQSSLTSLRRTARTFSRPMLALPIECFSTGRINWKTRRTNPFRLQRIPLVTGRARIKTSKELPTPYYLVIRNGSKFSQ